MAKTTTRAMPIGIDDEIQELKRKIALLDGDNKAYSENSQWKQKQNKDLITQLRAENKKLRVLLAGKLKADDDVISQVFKDHRTRPPADLKGVTGEVAVNRFDQSVCELIKRHNALQHSIRGRQLAIAGIKKELEQIKTEAQLIASTPAGDSVEAQQKRQLENRLDKAIIKCNEAAHISKAYSIILEKLEDEHLNFDNEITDLEKAIQLRQRELKDLESMCADAQLARDMAKEELFKQEQSISESRREREKVLAEYKRQAEERKEFAEKVERRLRRMSPVHDSLAHLEAPVDTTKEDQEAKISSYEEAMAKIKDATGVSDIQEVVDRFLNQGDTKKHLEHLREENTQWLDRLKEDKEKLQAHFEDMKYSGEAKMSNGQRMLEEFQEHLEEAKNKCKESKEASKRSAKLLQQVMSGVEHLTERMKHIKAPPTHTLRPKLDPDSKEYVLEQLSSVEQKLVSLAEELSSRDLETVQKEMEDEEFRHTVEGGTTDNIRITIPKGQSKATFYDEDSGSDEEFMSREMMKHTTQALVEQKTKKKPQDDEDENAGGKRKRRR